MTQRILIMGLPGSGKTTLAQALRTELWHAGRTVAWFNADEVRKRFDDWDFSLEGRIRQSRRMRELSDQVTTDYVIADFVAPLESMRTVFQAHWVIWMDTIDRGRYEDTNQLFVPPVVYDFRVATQAANSWSLKIASEILPSATK
jgi:adenylylsulfate kinase